jgi:hypothetical protein
MKSDRFIVMDDADESDYTLTLTKVFFPGSGKATEKIRGSSHFSGKKIETDFQKWTSLTLMVQTF